MQAKISYNWRVVIGSTLFAFASSAFLHFLSSSSIDKNLLRGAFHHYQGQAYLLPVKYIDGELSVARLYEDDRLLGPANSDLQEVIDKGFGRFLLLRDAWNYRGPALMFSTSDNTDPNTNGRKYYLK